MQHGKPEHILVKTPMARAGRRAWRGRTGLVYKVGLGVVMVGAAVFASSWLLGGLLFAALMDILPLLGAPEDRNFLPAGEPEAGGDILRQLGGVVVACGVCMLSLRLVVELAGKHGLAARLDTTGRLGLGAAAVGLLAVVSTGIAQDVLYEVFLYDYGRGAAMQTLETVGVAGGVLLLGGVAVFVLARPTGHRVALGWTDTVGWGRMRCGWINRLALALIALALVAGVLGFESGSGIAAAAGIGILLAGIVPHVLAGQRP